MAEEPHRLLVLADDEWNDYEFLKQEFRRLASIYHHIVLIYPDDTRRWQLYIRDWCRENPDKFTPQGYRKDVFTHGTDRDLDRDWRMLYDGLPDEVWKIESSKGYTRRPKWRIFPELWDACQAMDLPSTTFRAPFKYKMRGREYYAKPVTTRRYRRKL